jgi:hypothetical protein
VKFLAYPSSVTRPLPKIVLTACLVSSLACGPEDYQKPIQDFQNAANTIIAADRAFLSNENSIEQNKYIDQQVFEQKPFGPDDVEKQIIISPAEIKLRTDALDALAQYTTSLATLAKGKTDSSTGQNIKQSGTSLQTAAAVAGSQTTSNSAATADSQTTSTKEQAAKDQAAFKAKFSGLATAAATAIGAVAQLVIEHRARTEIKKSVAATDSQITALIDLIGEDAQGSYLRQQNQLGGYSVQLYNDYKCEILVDNKSAPDPSVTNPREVECPKRAKGVQADPVVLLTLADRLKSLQIQRTTLANANPATAITQMQKAHTALVAYVSSNNKDTSKLSDLITDVKNFVSAAQPLEQAVQKLMTTTK